MIATMPKSQMEASTMRRYSTYPVPTMRRSRVSKTCRASSQATDRTTETHV